MKAAEAWVALCRAGVALEDDGGGLALRVPLGVEPGPWLALGRAFGAHLRPLASGAWRAEVGGWPPGMRDEWDERAALRALDDGLSCDEAERAAFLEVRERTLEPHAATLGALGRELGTVLVRIEACSPEAEPRLDAQIAPAAASLRPPVQTCLACGQGWEREGQVCLCPGRSSGPAGARPSDGGLGGVAATPLARFDVGARHHRAPLRSAAPRGLRLVASAGGKTGSFRGK